MHFGQSYFIFSIQKQFNFDFDLVLVSLTAGILATSLSFQKRFNHILFLVLFLLRVYIYKEIPWFRSPEINSINYFLFALFWLGLFEYLKTEKVYQFFELHHFRIALAALYLNSAVFKFIDDSWISGDALKSVLEGSFSTNLSVYLSHYLSSRSREILSSIEICLQFSFSIFTGIRAFGLFKEAFRYVNGLMAAHFVALTFILDLGQVTVWFFIAHLIVELQDWTSDKELKSQVSMKLA